MLEGTKRLFPDDYQRFKENMIEAANDNSLPVVLQMDDIRDYILMTLTLRGAAYLFWEPLKNGWKARKIRDEPGTAMRGRQIVAALSEGLRACFCLRKPTGWTYWTFIGQTQICYDFDSSSVLPDEEVLIDEKNDDSFNSDYSGLHGMPDFC